MERRWGRLRLLSRPGGWRQVAEIAGSDGPSAWFGFGVAVSGTTGVVGARGADSDAGRAYVFNRSSGAWRRVAELAGSYTAAAGFGESVATQGGEVVVGASDNPNGEGRAYVFDPTNGRYREVATLVGRDIALSDGFGGSVALANGLVVVGAPFEGAGQAYVFRG